MDTFKYMELQKKGELTQDEMLTLNPSIENDKAFISNELITAIFHKKGSFTAIQLLIYIASRDEANTIKKGEYYHIRIDLNDFITRHGTKRNTLYNHLDNIQKTIVTFYDKKDKKLWDKISLISKQEKITRNIIQIDMHEKIYSKIKESENFSILNSTNFQNSLSFNSLRVLLLCGMINNYDTPRKEFTLEELNFLFDTNYKRLIDFERQIFHKAKVELDNDSTLSFDIEKVETLEISNGRPRIKSLRLCPIVNNEWNDNKKFVAFRNMIRKNYTNQEIIYVPDLDRKLTVNEDGLLMVVDGKILSRPVAVKWWNYIYKNKDKLITPQLSLFN
ncbi:hypothetical protein N3114_12755 (plasmid) [Aliarcobacter butzleri]|uniref:replication initiation protein n=1 Tax=Aliarcobacter butzleri TaxID=28197 RepID=UPI0021B3AFB9|nr:replication initiation protein [Aliarcobacter butzleri]UXC30725.1 hypothetical protein N3114_12755 [Aliarcobacter butzleri]